MPAKRIVLKDTGQDVHFTSADLPMLIHGAARAGASLFSVAVIANLFLAGEKILFFTAYPMAREEFNEQIASTEKEISVYSVENVSGIPQAESHQAIIVKSGDSALCLQTIQSISDVNERIIFVKNIESVLTQDLYATAARNQKVILSGDIDQVAFKNDVAKLSFRTKIFFSQPGVDVGIKIPKLEQYTGFIEGREHGRIAIQTF